ncbi:MarR family transcriptional regulator [Prauserella marina]|uniref:DNA-binding transcriptional regulator, MarR family n=1 Tax=Prauserella marina TaxID=530584 RepID=A0A222VZX8_9PSEU|nr:MarR family transcriptional regulator [Prauserella marina]ASR39506.1 MarR family transcriptional regulator [Prauserella marina]PWV80080.1 DNA-binding MarR family transcriptional regulator [Prauserella marina]SDD83637.1 DNA-binding transcriptional regulator, MarR family [Prauserella marina]
MSQPRWLSDEEQRVWRDFSAAVGMLRAHLESQLQHDAGMPHTYYEVLVVLSEAPGRVLRMSDLALATRSSRSRLSHAIARMEANGWVRRESCPTDKRGAFAHLTAEGMAALEAAAPGHVDAVRASLFDPLTPEQVAQLGEIVAAVREGLSPRCAAAEAEELERYEAAE